MRELNANGIAKFNSIDKKYKLTRGSARNTYHELIKNENLWRVTVTMDRPPVKDIAVIVLEQSNVEQFNKNRIAYLKHQIDDSEFPLNRYLYSGDIGSPYGILFLAPIYQDGDVEHLEAVISTVAKGVRIRTSLVSDTLVGRLGFRRIDHTKTLWYRNIRNLLLEKQSK